MECLEETQNEMTILSLCGRLDAITAPLVEARLLALIDGGAQRLIIDCAELAYISSAGLRVLLIAAKRLARSNRQLLVAALNRNVQEVFDLTGFTAILPVCRTREEAIASEANKSSIQTRVG